MWSWNELDVAIDETAGLCIGQNDIEPENYLSCWSVQRKSDGKFESNKSYLVDPLEVAFDTTDVLAMDSLDATQEITFVANGAWTCVQNTFTNVVGFD